MAELRSWRGEGGAERFVASNEAYQDGRRIRRQSGQEPAGEEDMGIPGYGEGAAVAGGGAYFIGAVIFFEPVFVNDGDAFPCEEGGEGGAAFFVKLFGQEPGAKKQVAKGTADAEDLGDHGQHEPAGRTG